MSVSFVVSSLSISGLERIWALSEIDPFAGTKLLGWQTCSRSTQVTTGDLERAPAQRNDRDQKASETDVT